MMIRVSNEIYMVMIPAANRAEQLTSSKGKDRNPQSTRPEPAEWHPFCIILHDLSLLALSDGKRKLEEDGAGEMGEEVDVQVVKRFIVTKNHQICK